MVSSSGKDFGKTHSVLQIQETKNREEKHAAEMSLTPFSTSQCDSAHESNALHFPYESRTDQFQWDLLNKIC